MGTAPSVCFTDSSGGRAQSKGDVLLSSFTVGRRGVRWTERTRTAEIQHGGAPSFSLPRLWGKTTYAYLAEAKMCSYLGDHRTASTSALWPAAEIMVYQQRVWGNKKRKRQHWPWRTWIREPDFRSHSWILGSLVPTKEWNTNTPEAEVRQQVCL